MRTPTIGLLLGVAAIAAACGKDQAAPPPPPPSPATSPPPATPVATKPPVAPAPPAAGQRMQNAFCQQLQLPAVATSLGLPAAKEGSSTKSKSKGRPRGTCSFAEAGKGSDGLQLTLQVLLDPSISTDPVDGIAWEALAGTEPPAHVARADGAVHVQTISNGVRVTAKVARSGATAAELEPVARRAVELATSLVTPAGKALLEAP